MRIFDGCSEPDGFIFSFTKREWLLQLFYFLTISVKHSRLQNYSLTSYLLPLTSKNLDIDEDVGLLL